MASFVPPPAADSVGAQGDTSGASFGVPMIVQSSPWGGSLGELGEPLAGLARNFGKIAPRVQPPAPAIHLQRPHPEAPAPAGDHGPPSQDLSRRRGGGVKARSD